jgi:hypothetical protein
MNIREFKDVISIELLAPELNYIAKQNQCEIGVLLEEHMDLILSYAINNCPEDMIENNIDPSKTIPANCMMIPEGLRINIVKNKNVKNDEKTVEENKPTVETKKGYIYMFDSIGTAYDVVNKFNFTSGLLFKKSNKYGLYFETEYPNLLDFCSNCIENAYKPEEIICDFSKMPKKSKKNNSKKS